MSDATNLVDLDGDSDYDDDVNGHADVFLYDRHQDTTRLVSVTASGVQANGTSNAGPPAISGDGRYVVFATQATNLATAKTNPFEWDVVRWNRLTGSFDLVSVKLTGGGAGFNSGQPTISNDGNLVAFDSSSAQLVPADPGAFPEVFVRDMAGGITSRVSAPNSTTVQPNGNSSNATISSDGRYVSFHSTASDLITGDTNGTRDVFVRDLQTQATVRASVDQTGAQFTSYNSSNAGISGTGNLISFARITFSGTPSVHVWVRASGKSFPVTPSDYGGGQLSADGRWLAYKGSATWDRQLYVKDLWTQGQNDPGAVVPITSNGLPSAATSSSSPALSRDGRYIAFESDATDIVSDTNGKVDVFLRDRGKLVTLDPAFYRGPCGTQANAAQPCGTQSDPVNSFTGAFLHEHTDVVLPGIGMPFAFSRSYTSADATVGRMGRGWSDSLALSLDELPNGNVIFRTETGVELEYVLQAGGSFRPPWGAQSSLHAVTGGYEVRRRDHATYTFDGDGLLVAVADRNGNEIQFAHTAGGQLDSITDTAGRQIDVTHDASGHLTSLVLPDGRDVSFGYTGDLLTSFTDLRGKTTAYGYDTNDLLDEIIDSKNNQLIANTYTGGRVTQQVDAMGEISAFAWNAATATSTMTDAKGEEWKDVYRGGVLARRIDPLGNTTEFDYDTDLNVTAVLNPKGHLTRFEYDDRGNMLEEIAPGTTGGTNTYTYDAQNNLTSIRHSSTKTTTLEYDTAGNLIQVTRPGGVEILYGRDPAGTGLLVSTTDPELNTTLFGYDADGNLDEITTPLGHKTTMAFDGSGRMTSMVEARGNAAGATPADYTWAFGYDDGDNLTSRTDPLGNVTEWTFDDAGLLDTMEDAKGRITDYGYNSASELTSVDPPGPVGATSYEYDPTGKLKKRTAPKAGHITNYSYDDAGRLAGVEDPLGRDWSYAYDANGNLTKVTTAAGNATAAAGDGEIAYSYNARNSLTGIDYSDSTPDVSFAYDYDETGRALLMEMTDGAGTETYGYDDLDRLTSVTRGSSSFSYAYDDADNLTKRTYPDGTVVDLTYDNDSRLDLVTTSTQVTDHTWDPAGNLTNVLLPNATTEARTYDRAGRLTQVTHAGGSGTLSAYSYTLDATGNPAAVQSPEGRITYAYDQLDRLTEACYGPACPTAGERIAFAYDGVGNRTSETRTPGGATTYAYDAADQLTSVTPSLGSPKTYAFDQNGNQTQAGSRTFTHDLANRMTSTTEGGTTTTYAYDGVGKRLSSSTGSQETRYTWDPNAALPLLVRESDALGGLIRRYVYGADLISQATPAASRFYHHDGLGSAVALTSATGAVEARYAYEPYGSERTAASLPPLPGSPPPPANPMRFTGEYLDSQSGLYHLRAREYDTTTGRFLQTDPLPQTRLMPYAGDFVYVMNRPTVLVDIRGLRGCKQKGYKDTNLIILFVSVGSYEDACGDDHFYLGIGLGLGYSQTFAPEQSISCDSTQAQFFTQHFVGGGGGRGTSPEDEKDWFGEAGFGTPGGSIQRNWVVNCPDGEG